MTPSKQQENCAETLSLRLEHCFFESVNQGHEKYRSALLGVLAGDVEYSDPAHELRGAQAVSTMLADFSRRIGPQNIRTHVLLCSETDAMWSWTVTMRPRLLPFKVELGGCTHAEIADGRIVRHREFYDPIGSTAKRLPVLDALYRRIIRG
jgi:hypothetical protein